MSNVKPFSPQDARQNKILVLPDFFLNAINQLLSEQYRANYEITLKAKDIIARAEQLRTNPDGDYTSSSAAPLNYYSSGYMDFKSVYEDAGWIVKYITPDYTESFDSYYTFEERK